MDAPIIDTARNLKPFVENFAEGKHKDKTMAYRNVKRALSFTNPSKVEREGYNTTVVARRAIVEADALREKLAGRRILECV